MPLFGQKTSSSPASVAARRLLAQQLLATSQNHSGGPLGAIATALGGSLSGYENRQAMNEESMGHDAASKALAEALAGGGSFDSLASAASNPWMSDSQSGLVNALLGKEIDRKYPTPTANQSDWQFGQDHPGFLDSMQTAASVAPANIQEWEAYNKMTPEQQGEYLRMKRANPYLDVGTGFLQPDPLNPGQTSGPEIVKDNFTPAYDEGMGGEQAKVDVETQAAAASLGSKLPGLKMVVEELGQLAEKATYTQTGQLWDNIARETGRFPSEGALARTKYMAMVDNQVLPLLRDTFGAAFTVKEGETLRATLGAPDKSPAEKKAVLEAFIEQKTRDLAALQSRLPQAPQPTTDLIYNPATGQLE